MTPFVQTKVIDAIIGQVEKRTGLEMKIGRVDFHPIESLVLEDVLIRDLNNDTLMFAGRVFVKSDSISFVRRYFTITELSFEKATFHLLVERNDEGGVTNIEKFIDLFSSPKEGEKSLSPIDWNMDISRIQLNDCRFTYREDQYVPVDYGINWSDVDCKNLSVTLSEIDFKGGTYRARVDDLQFVEKSGFRIVDMEGRMFIDDSHLLITESHIKTEKSDIELERLDFFWEPDREYWRYFTQKMQQYYRLADSKIHFDDLAYFNSNFLGMDNSATVSGEVSGTIQNLKGTDLLIELGERSVLQASFSSSGLPDFFETDFEIFFNYARISPEELSKVYIPWIESHYIVLPEIFNKYRTIDLSGVFKGKIEDFKFDGVTTTPGLAGGVDIKYFSDSPGSYQYGGSCRLDNVDYGYLTGQKMLGGGDVALHFNGEESGDRSIFTLKGDIGRLSLYNATLRDLKVNVDKSNQLFTLSTELDNDTIYLKGVMRVNSEGEREYVDMAGEIAVDRWSRWAPSIFGDEESCRFSFSGNMESESSKKREISASISDVVYKNSRGELSLEGVNLKAATEGDFCRAIFDSDVLDLSIEGDVLNVDVEKLKQRFLKNFFPSHKATSRYDTLPGNFNVICKASIKNPEMFLPVIYPALKLGDVTTLNLSYNDLNIDVALQLSTDSVKWNDIYISKPHIEVIGDKHSLFCSYSSDRFRYNPFGNLYNVRYSANIYPDNIDHDLDWSNWEGETYSGSLTANLRFREYRNRYITQLLFQPGVIVLGNNIWRIDRSLVIKEGNNIFVNNFEIKSDDSEQVFRLSGRVGDGYRDTLEVWFDNLDIREFNKLFFDEKVELFGVVKGEVKISDFYNDRLIYADMNLKNWGVNKDTLGNMSISSYWDIPDNQLKIGIMNKLNDDIPISAFGSYTPDNDSIDIHLDLRDIEISHVTIYLPELLSKGEGSLSGSLDLDGSFKEGINLNGFLTLNDVSTVVNVINTEFFFSDTLKIRDNKLYLDNLQWRDALLNSAKCSGYYDLFSGKYDVGIKFNDFLILNSEFVQDEMLYGQLSIDGATRIDNLSGHPILIADLQTGKESKLYIPLALAESNGGYNFLHFINSPSQGTRQRIGELRGSFNTNLDLNATLQITNDLELRLIFDPTVGDILKTMGRGDIRVSLDKNKELNVVGEYIVEQGDYLFTMSNLVNKRFLLTPGGSIRWSGSPYNALIDVSARYALRTSLVELLGEDYSFADINTKVKIPVECVLNLTENLSNPNVKFDIKFPSLDSQVTNIIQSYLSSEDEVNKQVFSLLIMNHFYALNDDDRIKNAGYHAGVTTASEMLSNQLSNWLSQISNNFDIGFSYRPGNDVTASEFEIALSTQIWNNRVVISANGNVLEGGQSEHAITGDFDVDVKLNQPGTLRLKAYSHTNDRITTTTNETIQGVGVSYQENFDRVKELLQKYFGFLIRKKHKDSKQ